MRRVTSFRHAAELEAEASLITSVGSAPLRYSPFPVLRYKFPFHSALLHSAAMINGLVPFHRTDSCCVLLCGQFWLFQTSLPTLSHFRVSLRPSHKYFENKLWRLSLSKSLRLYHSTQEKEAGESLVEFKASLAHIVSSRQPGKHRQWDPISKTDR